MRRYRWYGPLLRAGASIMAAAALISCGAHDRVTEPEPPAIRPRSLTFVSPLPRVTDGLRLVPDTIELQFRDSLGRRVFTKVMLSGTTGWIKSPSSLWYRAASIGVNSFWTDTLGTLKLLWIPGPAGAQRLTFNAEGATVTRDFMIARAAVPLVPDSAVPSGNEAVCVQRGGRVGCAGVGACASCGDGTFIDAALDSLHWFTLPAPPRYLSSTLSGVCALLVDGNTACWNGVGPTGTATVDAGHPPFVELTGSIGRTADGVVWKGVISGTSGFAHSAQNRTWNRVPSDSVITGLLTDYDETNVCGSTASSVVMCSTARRGLLEPSVIMQPFRLLRSLPDSAVVRARAGYTLSLDGGAIINGRIVVWTTSGTPLRFDRPDTNATGWFAQPVADSTLSGPDVQVRTCVRALDPICTPGSRPWTQVRVAGRVAARLGFTRICGVRDVMVCAINYLRPGGQGAYPVDVTVIDTVRIAP